MKAPDWVLKALDARTGQCVTVGPVQPGTARSIKILPILGTFGKAAQKTIKRELKKASVVNSNTEIYVVVGNEKIRLHVGECQPHGAVCVRTTGGRKTRFFFDDPESTDTSESSSSEED